MAEKSSSGLAVVTGASSGIGYELAKACARDGYDLIICANEKEIEAAAERLEQLGVAVETVLADLSVEEGVDKLIETIGDRSVELLMANAGIGTAGAFLDQERSSFKEVIGLNVTGTVILVHAIGRKMRERESGRILVTSSLVSEIPVTYLAVYSASKAFLTNFAYALREELSGSGVSVTTLMPGNTETNFYDRTNAADMPVAEMDAKYDAAKVAKDGYEAMMAGEAGISSGLRNKLQMFGAALLPDRLLAKIASLITKREKDVRSNG